MSISDAPTPRRMRRPRWLDVRVIGGVLLLVAAVVIGAKVIGASSRTSPVWAVTHDLAAGTVLRPADLTRADVNLGDRGEDYLDASSSLDGRILNRPVHAGELLPASSVGEVGDARIVSVSVAPDRMAPGVAHGSVIDLYLTSGGSEASGTKATTTLLQGGVTVQTVTAPASGGLSAATSNSYQVALLLSPTDADALVRALPGGDPMVVLRTSDAGGRAASGNAGVAGADPQTSSSRRSSAPTAPSSAAAAPSTQGG